MRSFIWCYRTANFKFEFLRCGSRWVEFANLAKFDFKFGRKKAKAKYFCSRRGAFKFGDGSYLVGNDRAKFKSNEV